MSNPFDDVRLTERGSIFLLSIFYDGLDGEDSIFDLSRSGASLTINLAKYWSTDRIKRINNSKYPIHVLLQEILAAMRRIFPDQSMHIMIGYAINLDEERLPLLAEHRIHQSCQDPSPELAEEFLDAYHITFEVVKGDL